MSAKDAEGVTRHLAGLFPDVDEVRITGVASVGAQRKTLFIDLVRNGETKKAVAQIAGRALDVSDTGLEAALLRAARAGGVAVPRVLAWDEKTGTLVTSHVEGESIPRRILRKIEADAALGPKLTTDCGSALAAIHRIPTDAFERLPALADPFDYANDLERLLETLTTPHPSFRLGLRWLRRHAIPSVPQEAIVHGDFRLGNLLVSDDGLSAVLDWELAHRGDPMEDLAWLCLRTWRFGNDDRTGGGFGGLDGLREAYAEAGGQWRDEAFAWWTVARTLWWGLGLARQAQAFVGGEADSIVLAASGRRVVELEYDLLRMIGA